jgi:hypothetical protein
MIGRGSDAIVTRRHAHALFVKRVSVFGLS